METKRNKLVYFLRAVVMMVCLPLLAYLIAIPAYAALSYTFQTDTSDSTKGIVFSSTDSYWSETNGVITGTLDVSSAITSELTITNASGKDGTLTMTYTYTVQGSTNTRVQSTLTVDGTVVTANKGALGVRGEDKTETVTVSKLLNEDGSITIKLYDAGSAGGKVTIDITNLSWQADESVTVQFNPVSIGAYTVSGESVSSESKSLTAQNTVGFTITPPSGYILVGFTYSSPSGTSPWENDGTNVFKPSASCAVTPIFVEGDAAPFKIKGTGALYYTWQGAFTAAAAGSGDDNKTVVLNSDFTLPNGADTLSYNLISANTSYVSYSSGTATYTVPSGCRFLVPFDSGNTMDFDEAPTVTEKVDDVSYWAPNSTYTMTLLSTDVATTYAYRTLTVPSNTTVNVKGSMNVNSGIFISTFYDTSCPHGPYGLVVLQDSSSDLVVQSGGYLYCYGYIMGSFDSSKNYTGGTVTAENGATVYEMFQIRDWRGGNSLSDFLEAGATTFPMSQFYVQSIEADYLIKAGATSKVSMNFFLLIMNMQQCFNFFGSDDGLFRVESGSVLRSYSPLTEYIEYTVTEDSSVSLENMVATFDATIMSVDLDTANYILGLNNNMAVTIESGATVTLNQRIKLLPGVQVIVENGGNLIVSPIDDTTNGALYVYDYLDWSSGYTQWSVESNTSQSHTIAEISDGLSGGTCYRNYNNKNTQNDVVRYSPSRLACYGTKTDSSDSKVYPVVNSANNKSASGKLVVNGTLTANGNVFTSSKSSSPDTAKVITGTGVFDNTASYGTSALDEWTNSAAVSIAASPAIALLSGVSTDTTDVNDSFGVGTYYGLGKDYNNYWYQWEVSATAAGDTSTGATVTGTSVPTIGAKSVGSNVLVGYIANSYTTNGSYIFTVAPPTGYTLDSVTASNGTLSGSGPYTLTDVTADTTITLMLTQQATGATYHVTITWEQTSTATYTPGTTTYTWSPTELKYTASTAEAKWDGNSVMKITIDNSGSTGAVTASFDYSQIVAATPEWSGLTDGVLPVDAKGTGTATLSLAPTGKPDAPADGTDSVILGTITITLEKGG